ncbi:MAG: hypothetical protein ACERKZ_21445 [Lachnotalea sp.]
MGGNLKNYVDKQDSQDDDVYARGKDTIITNSEIEQAKDFYIISGLGEEEATTKSIEYVTEREALYQAAIQNGYSVTDEEVLAYLEELKEIINEADNKEDAMEVISQFDSEQDYWDYEFSVYQKDLPIQNYVADLEKEYMQASANSNSIASDSSDASEIEENWQASYEELKKELVADEEFEIINE